MDETENGFVWEHIQSYAEQAHGAWLGVSVKGPTLLPQPVSSMSLYSSRFKIHADRLVEGKCLQFIFCDSVYLV